MSEKNKIFFVGNAHLDPVWMWNWQEGSAEAKATIRSALDRMKEYPEFIFVCSATVVFEWVEEFDHKMFEEIKERVNEGRFILVGGWYVQPDCNLPSGESFARHSLYGQRYFKEKFGKTAEIGYNVDSFGHNIMIPQILKKSGMDRYLFMRPMKHEKEMPSELFKWQSPDGSSVVAWRIMDAYTANLQDLDDLERRMAKHFDESNNPTDSMMFFYGVGNHGGGPTKKNINVVLEYRKAHPEKEIVFSNVYDFFKSIDGVEDKLPLHTDDLQHHASGCYSAVSTVKAGVRRAENALVSAEVFTFMANKLINKKYSNEAFKNAWKNVLFCHFHDIMGGCSIKDAYTDVGYMLSESLSFARRTENNAIQSLSWAIDTRETEKGFPIVIFNPHGFDVEEMITINKQVYKIFDGEGKTVTIQHVHSQTHSCMARSDTAFVAKIPAMGYVTYYYKEESCDREVASAVGFGEDYIENECFKVEFEKYTGYVKSIYDKINERELLCGFGAVPVVIDEYAHDTWSHAKNYFDKEIARFADGEIKIVEQGPVRVTMKVINRYNNSTLTQYFSLRSGSRTVDVRASIDWHEKHKMLKLAYPTSIKAGLAYYEIPFGVIVRPTNGEEEPGQSWIAIRGENCGLAMLNNNKYSFSVKDNIINLTVVRSPIYGDHGNGRDDECEFTDQGRHDFAYSLMPLNEDSFTNVIKEAKKLNQPTTTILENNHDGYLAQSFCGVKCSAQNVIISAMKLAEDREGVVIRVYETDGKDTNVIISGSLLPFDLHAKINAYSVNTYYYSFKNEAWKEVLLTEYDV